MANHYIRLNDAGVIIHGFSDAFDPPQDGDVLIKEDGPRHFHEVWSESLINDRGQYRYKLVEGERVERTQEELNTEWTDRPTEPPSHDERLAAMESALLSLMGL